MDFKKEFKVETHKHTQIHVKGHKCINKVAHSVAKSEADIVLWRESSTGKEESPQGRPGRKKNIYIYKHME